MNKHETKFANTAKRIQKALLDLLETKDFSNISISEICEKANINRSTFYSHYENTYDLLNETREIILKNFNDRFIADENIILEPNKENNYFLVPRYLIPFLEYIKENKSIFKIYMNNLGVFHAYSTYEKQLEDFFIPICNRFGIQDKKTINYLCQFFFGGILFIVKDWINDDCNDDIQYLCNLIDLCVNPKVMNS